MNNQSGLKKHKCRTKCSRLSARFDNRKINCFGCSNSFYAQCFNLNLDAINQKHLIKENSHVQFVCGNCHEMLHRFISCTTSTDDHLPAKTTTTDKACSTNNAPVKAGDNASDPNITDSGNTPIAPPNHSDETLQLHASVKVLIDKLSTQPPLTQTNSSATDSNVETKIENIFSLLIKAIDKIDKLHTHENEKTNIGVLTSLIDKLYKSNENVHASSNTLNGLLDLSKLNDWSMNCDTNNDSISNTTGRPSVILQQTVDDDILNILRNSESRNWVALDQIMKNLNEQSNKIDSLLLHRNEQAVTTALNDLGEFMTAHNEKLNAVLNVIDTRNQTPIASPLVDSIFNSNSVPPENVEHDLNTGNPPIVDNAKKEAMSHHNNDSNKTNQVPESYNIERQKRPMSNLPDGGPGIGQITGESSSKHRVHIISPADNGNQNHRQTSSLNVDAINFTNITLNAATSSISTTAMLTATDESVSGSLNASLNGSTRVIPTTNATEHNEIEAFDALSSLDAFNNEIYVTKFNNATTCDDILTYLRNQAVNVDATKVFRLTKSNQDVSMLSFVSFKIETTKDNATKLLQPKFWPRGSYAKKFVRKSTPATNLGNFLSLNARPHQAT